MTKTKARNLKQKKAKLKRKRIEQNRKTHLPLRQDRKSLKLDGITLIDILIKEWAASEPDSDFEKAIESRLDDAIAEYAALSIWKLAKQKRRAVSRLA